MTPELAKTKSEDLLRRIRVRINPHLPTLESPLILSPRSAREVASRAFVLSYIVMIGFGDSGKEAIARVEDAGLQGELTKSERAFIEQADYSEEELSWAASFGESVLACAWAMNLIEFDVLLPAPDTLADMFLGADVVPQAKIASASLRPFEDLYLQADLHYRLHWASRRRRFAIFPPKVPEILVRPRRHAFDWIIGAARDWDGASLDT